MLGICTQTSCQGKQIERRVTRLVSRSLDTSWWSREAVPALTLAAESLREAVIRLAEHSQAASIKQTHKLPNQEPCWASRALKQAPDRNLKRWKTF